MKRVVVLIMGLLLLAGCGGVVTEESEATTTETAIQTTTQPATAIVPTEDIHWVASGYHAALVAGEANPDERFPLYLELPGDGIQLYGVYGDNYQGGVVLFHEGREAYFSDWGFAWWDYPVLAYHDFDSDGTKDIGVITLIAHGTFTHLTELHIVTIEKTDTGAIVNDAPYYEYKYIDHAFTHEDVTAWVDKSLSCKRGKQKDTIELTIDGKTFTADLEPGRNWQGNASASMAVVFEPESNGIRLTVGVVTAYENSPPYGEYLGEFTADVTFDGRQFHLTNIDYEPHALQEN